MELLFWKSKEELEIRGDHFPCRAFRKVFVFETYERAFGFYLGTQQQYQPKNTNEWHTNYSTGAGMSLTAAWHWGSNHGWYDGPHCCFSVGFIHILWHNDSCKKCLDGF